MLLSNLSPSGNDFLFIDNSSFESIEPKFALTRFPKPTTTIEDIINKCPLYARVTIRVRVTEIEGPQTIDSLTFIVCQVIDNSDRTSRQLTIYGDMIDAVQVNNCYQMSEITVSKYMGYRVLKSSDQTKIEPLPMGTITAQPLNAATIEIVGCIITNVAFDTLNAELLCPNCKSPCEVDENIVICSKPTCNTVSAVSMAVSKSVLKFTVENEARRKITLCCNHDQMIALTTVPITNKVSFVKQLIGMKINATYNQITLNVKEISRYDEVNSDTDNLVPEKDLSFVILFLTGPCTF